MARSVSGRITSYTMGASREEAQGEQNAAGALPITYHEAEDACSALPSRCLGSGRRWCCVELGFAHRPVPMPCPPKLTEHCPVAASVVASSDAAEGLLPSRVPQRAAHALAIKQVALEEKILWSHCRQHMKQSVQASCSLLLPRCMHCWKLPSIHPPRRRWQVAGCQTGR